MKILILGYGVSGKAAGAFLKKEGHEVIAVDKKGGEGVLLDHADLSLEGFDQVILSPGIAQTHPLVQKALQMGIEVIGEIELGFRHLKNRCFGITGSNGKTTTVTLIAHLLNAAGIKARALGNVGDSVCSYLLNADPDEILIIELSSFQLETLHAKILEAAIILNITPNHLDRHSSMQEYVEAKARIQHCLIPCAVRNDLFDKAGAPYLQQRSGAEAGHVKNMADAGGCKDGDAGEVKKVISDRVRYKPGGELFVSSELLPLFPNAICFEKNLALIDEVSYIQLEMPSKQSVQAAYLLCKRCGVTDVEFLHGLTTYKKPSHRIEWVAEIDGVAYYNDSKSSNIHSVMHAIGRMEGQIVLIIGGVHKGSSYKPWIEPFRERVRQIIAYGKAAPIMEYELAPHFPFVGVDRFADAVKLAKKMAKKQETVLLSPGCSSYDQFENYEQRGDEFKRLVRET